MAQTIFRRPLLLIGLLAAVSGPGTLSSRPTVVQSDPTANTAMGSNALFFNNELGFTGNRQRRLCLARAAGAASVRPDRGRGGEGIPRAGSFAMTTAASKVSATSNWHRCC